MGSQMLDRSEMRKLYEGYLQACNAHDFDTMATYYSRNIRVNDAPMDPDAVAKQFAPIVSAFPDWHWHVRNIAIEDDLISLHFTVTGTHRGAFEGLGPTGRRVTITEFTLYRVEGGKFADVWDLADMTAARLQIERDQEP
jgi:predicted ester cyclase